MALFHSEHVHRRVQTMTRRAFWLQLTAAGVLVGAAPALACPFCDGGPSGTNEVRAAIFGEGFWLHLAAAALPFLSVVALALTIHGPPGGGKGERSQATLSKE